MSSLPGLRARTSKANVCRLVQELARPARRPVAAERPTCTCGPRRSRCWTGLRLLSAWGFQYRASLVRTRPPADCGSYWRQAHDLLLLGVRGELGFPDSSLLSWMDPHTEFGGGVAPRDPLPYRAGQPRPHTWNCSAAKLARGWTVLAGARCGDTRYKRPVKSPSGIDP